MVSHLIRLRYRLMWNGFRRSIGTMIGAIFSALGYLYMLGMTYLLAVFAAVTPVQELSFQARGGLLVIAGAIALIVWIMGPIIFSSASPFTDVKNFLPFGIPNRQFIPGVIISAVVAPTGIGTLCILLAGSIIWGWQPAAIIAGILAALLGTLMCVLAMQVVVGALTNIISKRAVKDVIQLIVLVPVMLGGFIIFGALETIQEFWEFLPQLAQWIAFTPAGFLALPWFVAQGQWLLAVAHLLVMLAYVTGLVVAYLAIVNRATASAGGAPQREREQTGLGLIGKARTPMQVIWARSLLAWLKDPRYAASLIVIAVLLLFGVLETTVLDTNDFTFLTKILPAMIAYLLAFSISADLSYDSTGFSLHVTSGVRGVDDRLGRVFGLLTWALPVVIILTVAMVWATGVGDQMAAWLGLSIGVLFVGTGLSSVVSARYIYPVPPPGTSLMAQPEGGMGRIMIVQTVGMLVQLLLSAPVVVPAVVALLTGSTLWGIITLLIGVIYGAGMLWLGVRVGARWYERALPETYQSIVKVSALY